MIEFNKSFALDLMLSQPPPLREKATNITVLNVLSSSLPKLLFEINSTNELLSPSKILFEAKADIEFCQEWNKSCIHSFVFSIPE